MLGKYKFNLYLLLTGYESSSCDDKNDGYDEHVYTLGTIHILCKHLIAGRGRGGEALCVQMDFTRTFETTTKCNNINHFGSFEVLK